MTNNQITPTQSPTTPSIMTDIAMMEKIANNQHGLADINMLTSSKVTDQLKVFLIAQARNELMRVVKLTRVLDNIENKFIDKANDAIINDSLTLRQYSDIIEVITSLLARSNDIISTVLKDDSLVTILNTTIYTDTSQVNTTSVISQLKDSQSREKVRAVIQRILNNTQGYANSASTEEQKTYYDKSGEDPEESEDGDV